MAWKFSYLSTAAYVCLFTNTFQIPYSAGSCETQILELVSILLQYSQFPNSFQSYLSWEEISLISGKWDQGQGKLSPRAQGIPLFLHVMVMFKIFKSVYGTGPVHRTDTGLSVGKRPWRSPMGRSVRSLRRSWGGEWGGGAWTVVIYTPGRKISPILTITVGAHHLSFSPACTEGKPQGLYLRRWGSKEQQGQLALFYLALGRESFGWFRWTQHYPSPHLCHPWVLLGPASPFSQLQEVIAFHRSVLAEGARTRVSSEMLK